MVDPGVDDIVIDVGEDVVSILPLVGIGVVLIAAGGGVAVVVVDDDAAVDVGRCANNVVGSRAVALCCVGNMYWSCVVVVVDGCC